MDFRGEKPSKYFCNLENRNYTCKIIPKVELDDCTIITDQKDILNDPPCAVTFPWWWWWWGRGLPTAMIPIAMLGGVCILLLGPPNKLWNSYKGIFEDI